MQVVQFPEHTVPMMIIYYKHVSCPQTINNNVTFHDNYSQIFQKSPCAILFHCLGTIPILINVSNFCEGMHVLKITVVDENGLNATETIEFQGGANG